MFKNPYFQEALIWLVVTGITIYAGLFLPLERENIFLYGAWAGVSLANAMLRFKKAYQKNKEATNGQDEVKEKN